MPRTREQLEQAAADVEAWLDNLDPSTLDVEDASDLRAIGGALARMSTAESELTNAVAAARANGRSWGMIAVALGVTKQAARQRYGVNDLLSAADGDRIARGRPRPSVISGSTRTVRQPAITVEPRPDARWAVQTDGSQRAIKVFDRKQDAIADAKTRARGRGTELVIKDERGRIQAKDSHGNDPRSSKG